METIQSQREKHSSLFELRYSIQKAMSEVSGYDESEDMSTSEPVELEPMNPYDKNLAEGQIRLLSQTEQITYVVLVNRCADGYEIMPFSHYDDPATDMEFKTEFDGGMYLHTLQAWNCRTVPDKSLKESWLIGTLPENDLKDARTMLKLQHESFQLEDRLLAKTGMPLKESNDIRRNYMHEERFNFDALDYPQKEVETNQALASSYLDDFLGWLMETAVALPSIMTRKQMALAAGDEETNQWSDCRLSGHDEVFSFEYAPKEGTLRLKVLTSDSEDSSTAFDGWKLVLEDGAVLGVLEQGFCLVNGLKSFNGECGLQDPSGKICAFDIHEDL